MVINTNGRVTKRDIVELEIILTCCYFESPAASRFKLIKEIIIAYICYYIHIKFGSRTIDKIGKLLAG